MNPSMNPPASNNTAGWITALATVAGVCVAGAALVVTGFNGDDDQADGPGGGSQPPKGSAVATAASSPDAEPPGPAPVLWTGSILLDGTPVQLDTEPPQRGNTSTDMSSDVVVNGSTAMGWFGGRLAAWRETGAPERDECVALIGTRGVKEVPIDAKSRFCVRTNEGRFAYIIVRGREGDGYDADVTLWSNA